jgi:hypothetical protein
MTNYSTLFNLSDDDSKDKTYIELILEDVFGLNNPLLQTQESLIKSKTLLDKRKKMVEDFKNVMMTSQNKKSQMDEQKRFSRQSKLSQAISVSNIFERNGFIIVFDITEHSSLEDAQFILKRLYEMEKTNGIKYEKCVLANKTDKVIDKKRFLNILHELDAFRKTYKCMAYLVSAKTNEMVSEGFKEFLLNVFNKNVKEHHNNNVEEEGFEIPDIDLTCTEQLTNCGNRAVCGNRLFACGKRPDD